MDRSGSGNGSGNHLAEITSTGCQHVRPQTLQIIHPEGNVPKSGAVGCGRHFIEPGLVLENLKGRTTRTVSGDELQMTYVELE